MSLPQPLLLDLVSPLPSLDETQLRAWARGRTVMISSTMRDLMPERDAVAQTVADFGATPRYFEEFSSPGDPAQVYHPEVGRADVYLFIAGERYGAPVASDPQGRSATHLEYDTAYASYKPVLAYNKLGVEREPAMQSLVSQLEGVHTVARFGTINELKRAVREGLTRLAEADSTTWVKLDQTVFPVSKVTLPPATGNAWDPQRQRRSVTLEASLRDRQILAALGDSFHARPLTLAREVFDAEQVRVHEDRASRYAVTQRIEANLRPASASVLTIIPIANGESGEEQLEAAMDSLLFGKPVPERRGGGGLSFLRALSPVGPRLAQLHRQLAAHHREAELFVPMAELLLTDRLLRGTPQDPAPLTALEQLFVSPVVQDRLFVRVVGVHVGGNFGGSHRVTREGHINLRGPVSAGIDGW
ncbi:DUF4062 domain-containing protein [Deinococcus aestuarii]|uniref:DUF4062 domain-containing protein n=1 Tax=Deinococcus aestuarii TaxID=2774531 RepID=UPI001C0B18C9|nr:DUF4062 domain-containing protein [Deinococcus aestuarii]